MKYHCYQLSTGLIFRTLQEIVFTSTGCAIDNQAVTDDESSLTGSITVENKTSGRIVNDMQFHLKDIVASWLE